jgi:hypothetical protein
METETTLTRHFTAGAIIVAYKETCATIRRTYAEIAEAERNLNIALQAGKWHTGGIKIAADRNYQSHFDQPDETIKRLRRGVWDQLVVKLELQKFLSVGKWKELQRLIEGDEMPEIDEESIGSFVQGLIDQRGDLLADAVRETFEFLRPRGWTEAADYKSNSQDEVPRKVVLTWMVEPMLGGGRQLRYDRRQQVLAMERVFQMLDGKGEISREHFSELEVAIKAASVGETTWFRYSAHKNGNVHLEFRRRDLLAKFNQIAGGHNLKAKHKARTGAEIEVSR